MVNNIHVHAETTRGSWRCACGVTFAADGEWHLPPTGPRYDDALEALRSYDDRIVIACDTAVAAPSLRQIGLVAELRAGIRAASVCLGVRGLQAHRAQAGVMCDTLNPCANRCRLDGPARKEYRPPSENAGIGSGRRRRHPHA